MNADWFLAKDMFLGLGRAEDPFVVLRMRRGDVDRLDSAIGEERLVRAVGLGNLVMLGKLLRLGFGAAANGNQLSRTRAENSLGENLCDASRPNNSPAKLGHALKCDAADAKCKQIALAQAETCPGNTHATKNLSNNGVRSEGIEPPTLSV